MSAFLSSGDALNALATYWTMSSSRGYTSAIGELTRAFRCHQRDCQLTGAEADQTAWQLIEAAEAKGSSWQPWQSVQQILLLENQRSLAARYPEDEDFRSAGGDEYKPRRSATVSGWVQGRKTGQLVGILNGYEYQSCEHDGWTTSVAYHLCQQIRRQLLNDLETRDCIDETRGWASWQEPEPAKDQPQAICLSDLLNR